jgi:hypothetical protein
MSREDLLLLLSNQLVIMRTLWITSASPINDDLMTQIKLTRARILATEHDHKSHRQ